MHDEVFKKLEPVDVRAGRVREHNRGEDHVRHPSSCTRDPVEGDVVRGENCIQWMADLAYLIDKQENNEVRHISNYIADWNVAQKILIPLMKSCKDDTKLVNGALKIILFLSRVT